jgi:hypothetical protein
LNAPLDSHTLASVTRTIAMRAPSFIMLTVVLCVLAWRPGRVQQVPFLRASFWQGLSLPVQIYTRTAHSVLGCLTTCHMSVLVRAMCEYYYMIMC